MESSFRFCTLLFAVSVCGCAQQRATPPPPPPPVPHGHAVTLEVRTGSVPGYIQTYGSNGAIYSYMFTGGDKGHGNVAVDHSEGAVNIQVALQGDSVFTMGKIDFTDDDGQLSDNIAGNGRMGIIHDSNSAPLDAYYQVVVNDNTDSDPAKVVKIACDPRIVNN
jgi:hypothetical protein